MSNKVALIIASNFPPIQSAGVYRTLRLAKYLPALGWKLDVLTLDTNTLLAGTLTDASLLEQIADDIQVHRAQARFPIETFNRITGRRKTARRSGISSVGNSPAIKVKSEGHASAGKMFQRFKDRITLPWMTPDRLVGWVGPAANLGMKVARNNGIEVVYSSGPPWSNHLVAGKIVAATDLPWVADFRDPWVGNTFRPGRSEETWAGRKHRMLELEVYQKANFVIFNTERARTDAVARIGDFLAEKSVVIPNGFDPDNFKDIPTDSILSSKLASDRNGPLRMLHTGAFYGKRNADSLLAVIGELKQSGKMTAEDLQLELIGSVRPHEQKLIDYHSIADIVTLLPSIPHKECLLRLSKADVLLLIQTEAPLCVPGKLYEYIAIGKPILTLAADGATADLVTQENIGLCIDPNDHSLLKAGLLDLVRLARCGKVNRTTRERYDGSKQMALFHHALCRAMSSTDETLLSSEVAAT